MRLGFVLPRAINLPAIRKCAYSSIDEENDVVVRTLASPFSRAYADRIDSLRTDSVPVRNGRYIGRRKY